MFTKSLIFSRTRARTICIINIIMQEEEMGMRGKRRLGMRGEERADALSPPRTPPLARIGITAADAAMIPASTLYIAHARKSIWLREG